MLFMDAIDYSELTTQEQYLSGAELILIVNMVAIIRIPYLFHTTYI